MGGAKVQVRLGTKPASWPHRLFGQPDLRRGSTSSAASKPYALCLALTALLLALTENRERSVVWEF